jgi:2-polyprenyl-3-methyl-5-hydroxy-6-metoxy-1,4-benzoquinol methylase
MAEFSKTIDSNLQILDVGSYDVNGCLKPLFKEHRYFGTDVELGPNVDFLQTAPYDFPFKNLTFDIVVSANCLEHVEAPWKWVLEIDRVLKPSGKVAIATPWTIPYHAYPKDYWRISHDAFEYLFTGWMIENDRKPYTIERNEISGIDTIFVAKKL